MRIGVVADPHVSVERDESASWHNPYLLADAHTRLAVALAHPLVADADLLVLLGDLSHFGDRASIRTVVDLVAATHRPAILLSGNHDVLVDGVRLPDELGPLDAAPARAVLVGAGIGCIVHQVIELTDRTVQPFDVAAELVLDVGEPNTPWLMLTHFPIGSLEDRCREERFLYSGHLEQLAPPLPLPGGDGPVVALSGHLHLRGMTVEARLLQLSFAALVEPPYEVAAVDLTTDAGGRLDVAYECASVIPPGDARLPVLDPRSGQWAWEGTWVAAADRAAAR